MCFAGVLGIEFEQFDRVSKEQIELIIMRVLMSRNPLSTVVQQRPRLIGLLGGLGLVLVASCPAWTAPGLHLESIVGPLSDFFERSDGNSPMQEEAPLLRMQIPTHLFANEVEVDSSLVTFTKLSGGFPSGMTAAMNKDEYLDLIYGYGSRDVWRREIRQAFRESSRRERQQGNRRLEWTVPFTAPKPLRRFIGDEGPSLRMSGSLKVSISGKSEWTGGEVQTAAGRPSKFPALTMDQEQRFTVEGKVGELINVRIDQDTESAGGAVSTLNLRDQIANQIKLDYKNDEDAIFQEIQAGNTTLALPRSKFVGFQQQNKGLFGIRAKGAVGPLSFTTIASHESSKSNRRTFHGGAVQDTLSLRDYQFLRNTYFFLDEFYRVNLPDYRRLVSGARIPGSDFIDSGSLQIYINDFNTINDAELLARPGVARVAASDVSDDDEVVCINPNGLLVDSSGCFEEGTWHRLDPDDDYTVVEGAGFIILNRMVPERHALAVSYRTHGGPNVSPEQFGDTRGDTLQLKLIKARDARPGFPTWDLEWKNVYRIATGFAAGRKFDPSSLEVQVLKEIAGQESQPSQGGKSYLQIFGLDERGQDPGSAPDRVIDRDYIGLDDFRGHLIFPARTPFNPETPEDPGNAELNEKISQIYNRQQQRDQVEASTYIIEVRSSSGQQRISLGLGVRPETVEVRLNGERKQKGKDYNVGFAGDITFVGTTAQEVADPGADLEITYESEDLLGLGSQQKTLIGMRTQYEFLGGEGKWGTTMLYNNERSAERRVRVGAEPARTVVWSTDMRAKFGSPFLTRVVDALPFLKTATRSTVEFQGEVAQSRPNLNTKGKGFIDDFEGSSRPNSLRISRTNWTPSSKPATLQFVHEERGRLIWYNPFDGILRKDIWPGQEEHVENQNNRTDVLVMRLKPRAGQRQVWGGLMTSLGAVNDFSLSKFMEIWVRGDRGLLNLDLGTISEDFCCVQAEDDLLNFRDEGRLDTEDEPFPGRATGDGLVSQAEDVGIDRRNDEGELNFFLSAAGVDTTNLTREQKRQQFLQIYSNRDVNDPQGDNWHYDATGNRKNDYRRINGTEGNKNAREAADRPDSEDLNNDGVLNTRNDYYSYSIDLASASHIAGTESNGWRMFRIPLFDNTNREGLPDSSRIEFARLVVSGEAAADDDSIQVEIALIEVIGNEWQEDEILVLDGGNDVGGNESISVNVVGTDKNIDYEPPPGVKIQRNRQTRTREREQSLRLRYENLEPEHQMSATKVLTRNANYTQYTRMRMFVHGDDVNTSYVVGDSSDIELFVRFGADTTNYYEFITRILPGWDGGRVGYKGNEVDIDLLEIARLKSSLQAGRFDSLGQQMTIQDTVIAESRLRDFRPAIYRVRGNPSMQQIKELTIGVRNRGSGIYSGEVLVDELRLEEGRNDLGGAVFARVNTKLADVMNLDGQMTWTGGDFRTLNSRGRTSTDLNRMLSATTNIHRFLPGRWGFSIPFKATFTETENLPRFGPNSDVELGKKEQRQQRTFRTKRFYEMSLSKRTGRNRVLKWTIDQMNLRLSHLEERGSSTTRPLNRTDAQTMNFSYKMPLPSPQLPLFTWLPERTPRSIRELKWRYLPSTLSYSMIANRKEQRNQQRSDAEATKQENFIVNETYVANANPFSGVSVNYDLKINRDLRKRYELDKLSFGREIGRTQGGGLKVTLRWLRWLDQQYTFESTYNENSNPTQRRAQVLIDSTSGLPIKPLDIDTKNNLSTRFNLKLPMLLKSVGGNKKTVIKKRPQRPAKQAVKTSTKLKEEETEQEHRSEPIAPFFLWRTFNFAGSFIEPFNVTWRRNTNARSFNLTRRPGLLYQLGFKDSMEVPQASVGLTQQDGFGRTRNLDMGSGLKLPRGFSVKTDFNDKLERRSGSTQKRTRVRQETRFPKVNVTWSRADRIPLLRRVVNSAHFALSVQKTESSEGEGSLRAGNLITKNESQETRISWNGKMRIGPTARVERVVAKGTDLEFELVAAEDSAAAEGNFRPLRGSGELEMTTTTFSIKHNLRPRSIPIFGKLKSNVDLKFEITLEDEIRANGTGDADRAPISSVSKWRTSLTASYKFSDSFRGDGVIRMDNNRNNLTEKTRKIREVRFSGTMFFR